MAIIDIIIHIVVWCITNYVGGDFQSPILPYGHHHLTKFIWKKIKINQQSCCLHLIFQPNHEYYHWCIMGWDRKLQCLTPSGGLFDFCKRFITSTKFQGFGNLHAHWSVYTHDMPTTTLIFLQLTRDPNSSIMNHFIIHQTMLLQMEIPISKGVICPNYDGFL
jgi:hypothetical protein